MQWMYLESNRYRYTSYVYLQYSNCRLILLYKLVLITWEDGQREHNNNINRNTKSHGNLSGDCSNWCLSSMSFYAISTTWFNFTFQNFNLTHFTAKELVYAWHVCNVCQVNVMDARGKYEEHKRSIGVACGDSQEQL